MGIAELGLVIDSSQAAPAAAALDKLTIAAGGASAAASKLSPAAAAAGVALGATEKSTKGAADAHAGYSTQAMAAFHATRSMAEGLAMGIPPSQMLAMQMAHLSYAASGPGGLIGAFKQVGSMVTGLITPMRLLGVGVIGAGVAAYAMSSSWQTAALELDNVARSAGLTITKMRALQTFAEGGGISSFADDAKKFASNLYDARGGMGSLGDLLRVNGERATTFEGTLESVAKILQRAGSDQQRLQLLQQAGLPATMEWVRLLSQGPDAIRKAVDASSDLSDKEQELIDKARQFDEGWDKAWASFKSYATQAIIGVKASLKELSDAARDIPESAALGIPPVADVAGGPTRIDINVPRALPAPLPQTRPAGAPQAIDPNVLRNQISLEQQRLGLLGQTATVMQQVRLAQLQLDAAAINGAGVTATQAANLVRLARERALGIDQIKASKDAYEVEGATISMSVGHAAAYAVVQSKINEYKRNGVPLTEENISAIQREADAMGAAAQSVDNARFEFETFSGMMRDFGANLRQGQTLWQAFGNAGMSALGKIADRLMDMASRSLWNLAFPTGGGGGLFSLVGGLFGGSSGGSSGVLSGGLPLGQGGIGHNAEGTNSWRGGPTWVGEKGPEIIDLPAGARVTPNNKIGSGGGQPIMVTVAPQYTFNNADPSVEARLRQQIQQSAQDTQQKAVAAVQKLSQNSPGNYLPAKR